MYNDQEVIQDVGGRSKFLGSVFMWMFLGLLVTAATAYALIHTGLIVPFYMNPALVWIFFIAEFILVFYISRNALRTDVPKSRAKIAFIAYSVVNGLTLSSIFFVYNIGLIYKAFLAASIMFGVMALYGKYTKADLSKIGSILMMALIGVIVVSLLNYIFSYFGMVSGPLDTILGYITLVIFLGLTAWDIQKLSYIYDVTRSEEGGSSVAIYGALSLYLDFINIFLSLLRISSRD